MDRIKLAGSTLVLGLMASFVAGTVATNGESPTGEVPTVEFNRPGPCIACGNPTPVWIVAPDGSRWFITEPGTVQELGLKYCPQDTQCKVIYAD